MASQTCEQCGSIVAGDEQFCPSCGAFMDPMTTPRPPRRPRSTSSGNIISVTSDGPTDSPYEEFSLESPPPPADAPPRSAQPPRRSGGGKGNGSGGGNGNGGGPVECPSCGAVNPGNNRHCQECGARLRQGPLPTAPRPAVQATAGVRAALAISGLLLGVILIALFFNIFNGDDPDATASSTTTSTAPLVPQETGPIEILEEICDPPGIGGFVCANLTSGTPDEYQVSWEDNADQGITIRLTFFEPMAVNGIQWTNIEDPTRFRQNYRAQSLTIEADDSVSGPVPIRLQDQQGTQQVPFSAINTTTLEIRVVEAYLAEEFESNRFDELAIDEIVVIGRPVTSPTGTTVPAGSSTTLPDTTSTTSG